MRIVSLEPFLTEIVRWFGLEESLVAVSGECHARESIPRVTRGDAPLAKRSDLLSAPLSSRPVDFSLLKSVAPEIVLASVPDLNLPESSPSLSSAIQSELSSALGYPITLLTYNPKRLEDVFVMYTQVGVDLGAGARGRDLESRARAQMMDWADNFYERTKNKRVSVISCVEPLRIAGFWVPDMISMASGISQHDGPGHPDRDVNWLDIVSYKPDVLIVAPRAVPVQQSCKLFSGFEKRQGWDDVNAVKRGECFFADGLAHFYKPDPSLIDSMGVLISCMAGMDSGYITKRDSFFRLRYLELHRHRI